MAMDENPDYTVLYCQLLGENFEYINHCKYGEESSIENHLITVFNLHGLTFDKIIPNYVSSFIHEDKLFLIRAYTNYKHRFEDKYFKKIAKEYIKNYLNSIWH